MKVDEIIKERNNFVRRKTPNPTGYKGVFLDRRKSQHQARYESRLRISQPNKPTLDIYLGSYKTPELAYLARIKFIDSLK
jgi:hypothetical protein